MKRALRLGHLMGLALVALALPSNALAGTTVNGYSGPTAFQAAIAPGSFLEDFSSLGVNQFIPSPVVESQGGFGYSVDGANPLNFPGEELYSGNSMMPFVGNSQSGALEPVTVKNFTGNPVTAIGLFALTTDFNNDFTNDPISISVNGTVVYSSTTSYPLQYIGITDTVAITSLVVTTSSSDYAGIGYLVVGTTVSAVPEPSSLALLGIGSLVAAACVRTFGRRPTRTA
jgi:PEP-CTERM motif